MAKKVIKLTESKLKEMIENATLQALDKQLLAENRNFERAKKAVRTYCNPRDNDEIFIIIHDTQHNVPYSRICKDKYLEGVIRLIYNEELDESQMETINDILNVISNNTNYILKYNGDFNGLYYEELLFEFYDEIENLLQKERETSAKQEYIPNQSYSVIEIKNFSDASKFSKCVDWCIVRSKFDFETYTTHGETFYFCLKDGYEKISCLKGEGHPLDSYGLSMIAVSVRKNGRLATCTTRWNEASNGNRILTIQQISQLLGMDFYSVFKPKR